MEALVDQQQTSSTSSPQQQLDSWRRAQDSLRQKLVKEDDFPWQVASSTERGDSGREIGKEPLKYIGGVDISFSNDEGKEAVEENSSNSIACAMLVVLECPNLNVVYEDFSIVKPHVPYVPGFLAFREAPILLELLNKMKKDAHPFYPQLLMVDGNGLLHPRGFGLACHLGVLANLPTIGVGKNLHHVDGLDQSRVRKVFSEDKSKECVDLIGSSGSTLGMALRSAPGVSKPIYISIGHRISLSTAVRVAKMTCKYRVPEPIRQADIRSRDYIRTHPLTDYKVRTHPLTDYKI